MVDSKSLEVLGHDSVKTILVVDDETLVRTMVAEPLRDEGYKVIEAINGDEALTILRSGEHVDLVLTDMRMHGTVDGAMLARLIRTEFPYTRVILVSSIAPDDSLRAALDGYIPKPFTFARIQNYVLALTPLTPVTQ
jgi:CheY-like chemotaxis protein